MSLTEQVVEELYSLPLNKSCCQKAFICGMHSGNYDLSKIFIDSLYKVSKSDYIKQTEDFLLWAESFGAEHGIDFVITISADDKDASDVIRKFF